jgi:Xaa-Pro aminopeptidase
VDLEAKIVEMDEILRLLVERCSFLWARQYTIARSGYGINVSDAYIDIESRHKKIKLEFIRERGQLSLDVYGLLGGFGKDRYPIDILRTMVMGEPYLGDTLSDAHVTFLKDNIDAIEAMFADEENATELHRKVRRHIKARLK